MKLKPLQMPSMFAWCCRLVEHTCVVLHRVTIIVVYYCFMVLQIFSCGQSCCYWGGCQGCHKRKHHCCLSKAYVISNIIGYCDFSLQFTGAASTYFLTLKRQNHQNQNPDGRRSTLAKQRKRQRKHNVQIIIHIFYLHCDKKQVHTCHSIVTWYLYVL